MNALCPLFIVWCLASAVDATVGAPSLPVRPRMPLPKTPVAMQPAVIALRDAREAKDVRVVVKFTDASGVRVSRAASLMSNSGADMAMPESLIVAHAGRVRPALDIGEARLQSLIDRATERSGRAQPDLLGLVEVVLPADMSLDERIELAQSLQDLSCVEITALVPPLRPAGDTPPFTPWMAFLQTYQHADPGIDVDFAWSLGLRGNGVRVSDIEYAWNGDHEDLAGKDLHPEPGQTPTQFSIDNYQDHGTAVAGALAALDNDYGCTGMMPDVEMFTYPGASVEEGSREEDAVAAAIADSAPGDVVLAELQAVGDVVAETLMPMWLVVSVAKDAGVVVVEPAGNGSKDLDKPKWATWLSWGDSGAIIVGAGTDTTAHEKLSFSTFGSRVNVQGWGQDVFTLGYGDFAVYGDDPNQKYTQQFSGTSSASPMVVAACVALEQRAKEVNAEPLDPLVLRQLLVDTGHPQSGSGGHIGPLPDLHAAFEALPTAWSHVPASLPGDLGTPVIDAKGPLKAATLVEISLGNVHAGARAFLVAGLAMLGAPFKGGLLVPHPDVVLGPLTANAAGAVVLDSTWPAGVPSGTVFGSQWWILDSSGPAGFVASDGVVGVVP